MTKKKPKKRRRYTLPSLFDVEAFYRAINGVQLTKKAVTFLIPEREAPVIDNILSDLSMIVKKRLAKKATKKNPIQMMRYRISPSKNKPIVEEFDDCEEFPDEIAEDGQVFFD